jgi:serine/threonine protein kinase
LFCPKGRQKIYEKQIEVVNNIENVLKNSFIEDSNQKELVIDLLKKMLNIDYSKRISPEELLEHNFLKLI